MPDTTRITGVIKPFSMEYLKNSSPARPRAIAPTTAAPRIPIQRSQSIGAAGGSGGVKEGGALS